MKKVLVLLAFILTLGMNAQTNEVFAFDFPNVSNDSLPKAQFNTIKLESPLGVYVDNEELTIQSIILTKKLVSKDYLKTLSFKEQVTLLENSKYKKLIEAYSFVSDGEKYSYVKYIKYDAFSDSPFPMAIESKYVKYASK